MSLQEAVIVNGVKLVRGVVLVFEHSVVRYYETEAQTEKLYTRRVFVGFDPNHKLSRYLLMEQAQSGKYVTCGYHSIDQLMNKVSKIDRPTDQEQQALMSVLAAERRKADNSKFSLNSLFDANNIGGWILLGLVLLAAIPPVGVVFLLCLVFSKNSTGFISFLVMILIFLVIVCIARSLGVLQ